MADQVRSPGSSAHARAMGVEREPGQMIAWRTPERASSSTRERAQSWFTDSVTIDPRFALPLRRSR